MEMCTICMPVSDLLDLVVQLAIGFSKATQGLIVLYGRQELIKVVCLGVRRDSNLRTFAGVIPHQR